MQISLATKKYGEIKFLIDETDFEIVKNLKLCVSYSSMINNFYIMTTDRQYLHRILTNAPKGKVVDHLNHNTLDNRQANLRICSYSENGKNRYNAYIDNQKLKTYQVKNILLSSETNKKLALKYNVSTCLISAIRNGKMYVDYFPEIQRKIYKPTKVYKLRKRIKMQIKNNKLTIANLTLKETQIYLYILEGYTDEKICKDLNISLLTFKTHLNNIYAKRDIHSKYGLVVDFLKNQECYKYLNEIKKLAAI